MPRLRSLLLPLLLGFGLAAAAGEPVVDLDYRLQPDRDLTTETLIDGTTTMRVIEDRGIVARSNGRLSSRPTTLRVRTRQAIRFVTGSLQADGSFAAEMHYVDKRSTVQLPDGSEQLVPEPAPLKGVRVHATVEPGGRLREGSVRITGVGAALGDAFEATIAGALSQAAAIEPLRLTRGEGVSQRMSMQLPVPGVASLDIQVLVVNRLVSVEDGLARIQQVYSMEFGAPASGLTMRAEGSGGGHLLYDIASRTVASGETGMLVKITLDTPEGLIEVHLDTRQTRRMRRA